MTGFVKNHSAFFFWYPFCTNDCKSFNVNTHNKKELLSPTTTLCCYCLSKCLVWTMSYFIHCGLLSLFLFIFNFSLFGCPRFYPFFLIHRPIIRLPLSHSACCHVTPTSFFKNLHRLFLCCHLFYHIIKPGPVLRTPSLHHLFSTSGSASSRWASCKAAG